MNGIVVRFSQMCGHAVYIGSKAELSKQNIDTGNGAMVI